MEWVNIAVGLNIETFQPAKQQIYVLVKESGFTARVTQALFMKNFACYFVAKKARDVIAVILKICSLVNCTTAQPSIRK